MLRLTALLTMLAAASAMAFSEIPDSSGRARNLDSLTRRMDSLQAELVQLRTEKEDHSIYAIGDALDWGKGFGIGMEWNPTGFGVELNYTFKALGFDTPYYLGNLRRFGLAIGAESWLNENPTLLKQDTTFSGILVPYAAVRLSSPVLLNFTSFNTAMRLFWTLPEKTSTPGWGLSQEMQFWLTRAGHFNIGFHLDFDERVPDSEKRRSNFRPYMGFQLNLGAKGDLRMRPA